MSHKDWVYTLVQNIATDPYTYIYKYIYICIYMYIYIYIYIYICIYIVCITIICYMIGYILLLYTLESKPMYISVEKAMLHINAIYSMLHIYRAIWPSPECWTYIQKWNLLLSYILCVYAYSLYTFLVLYICTLLIHIAICIYVVLI